MQRDLLDLLESFSRHFLAWINRWQGDGVQPVQQAWMSRTLEVGKSADAALIEADRPRHGPWEDPEAVVVWTGTPDDVALVVIDGDVRYRRDGP